MQITLDPGEGNQIKSYDAGSLTIGETQYHETLIVSQDSITPLPDCRQISDIDQSLLQSLISKDFDIILLGSGEDTAFLDPALIAFCSQHRVGVECMPTRSACRTYNLLAADHRQVIAILII